MSQTTPDYTQNFVLASQERQAIATEQRDNRNVNYIIDKIDDTSGRNLTAIDRTLDAVNVHAGNLGVQAEKLANETVTNFAKASAELGHFARETAKEHYEIRRDITSAKGDLERQAGDYFSKSQQDLIRVENSLGRQSDNIHAQTMLKLGQLELQSANNLAAIQLEAAKNKSDLYSAFAECCCEIKEKVGTSEASVKDLINSNENNRLRDSLQAAETRNLVLQTGPGRWGPPPPFYPPFFPPGPGGPPAPQ